MREWNAAVYHRVSDPQRDWAQPVLERLPLNGGELVVDVGCGTGRVTAVLAERLPRGRVVALDLSASMLATAAEHLATGATGRIFPVRASADALPFAGVADAIFSTATFHWVRDHDRLFASLFCALKPGGRLVAQCGGGPNLARLHARCADLMRDPTFTPYFTSWVWPWEFADAPTTAARLERAGFTEIRTSVEPAPVQQPDRAAFREFVAHVIVRPHLSVLPDDRLRDWFLDALADRASADTPPYELDYWRLNLDARKP
jgi:trans-aconitate 2-methyltransferase